LKTSDKILLDASSFLFKTQSSKDIDLTNVDNFSYSAVMRQLYKNCNEEQLKLFLKLYLELFNAAVSADLQKPDVVGLQNALVEFSRHYPIKISKSLIKSASITELGSPEDIGHYLANVVNFIMNKISDEKRNKSKVSLKSKLLTLNPNDLSSKNMPNSAAIGQAISFIKNTLYNHNPDFIRRVLDSTIRRI